MCLFRIGMGYIAPIHWVRTVIPALPNETSRLPGLWPIERAFVHGLSNLKRVPFKANIDCTSLFNSAQPATQGRTSII
jgi:hypothetical protein